MLRFRSRDDVGRNALHVFVRRRRLGLPANSGVDDPLRGDIRHDHCLDAEPILTAAFARQPLAARFGSTARNDLCVGADEALDSAAFLRFCPLLHHGGGWLADQLLTEGLHQRRCSGDRGAGGCSDASVSLRGPSDIMAGFMAYMVAGMQLMMSTPTQPHVPTAHQHANAKFRIRRTGRGEP